MSEFAKSTEQVIVDMIMKNGHPDTRESPDGWYMEFKTLDDIKKFATQIADNLVTIESMVKSCDEVEGVRDVNITVSRNNLKICGQRVRDDITIGVMYLWTPYKTSKSLLDEAFRKFKQHNGVNTNGRGKEAW